MQRNEKNGKVKKVQPLLEAGRVEVSGELSHETAEGEYRANCTKEWAPILKVRPPVKTVRG